MSVARYTYYGWTIVPVLDDDDDSLLGFDVHEPGDTGDGHPWAELVWTRAEACRLVKAEVRERRLDRMIERMGR